MNREEWLKEKRRLTEERMDILFAPIYDENWGTLIDPTHQRFYKRFLGLCPPNCHILDAACGTGKYWHLILDSGRTVHGIDQSQGMLARAHEKFPDVPIEKVGLQEMDYQEAFGGMSCMDAMEFIFPEDWLLVLKNFHRAIKQEAYLYFTVELAEMKEIEDAFAIGQQMGLPVVHGESAHEGGYHYYPRIEQVKEWLHQAHFRQIDETVGDFYHHFIVQKDLLTFSHDYKSARESSFVANRLK